MREPYRPTFKIGLKNAHGPFLGVASSLLPFLFYDPFNLKTLGLNRGVAHLLGDCMTLVTNVGVGLGANADLLVDGVAFEDSFIPTDLNKWTPLTLHPQSLVGKLLSGTDNSPPLILCR